MQIYPFRAWHSKILSHVEKTQDKTLSQLSRAECASYSNVEIFFYYGIYFFPILPISFDQLNHILHARPFSMSTTVSMPFIFSRLDQDKVQTRWTAQWPAIDFVGLHFPGQTLCFIGWHSKAKEDTKHRHNEKMIQEHLDSGLGLHRGHQKVDSHDLVVISFLKSGLPVE